VGSIVAPGGVTEEKGHRSPVESQKFFDGFVVIVMFDTKLEAVFYCVRYCLPLRYL
jgi:hypothetical protein